MVDWELALIQVVVWHWTGNKPQPEIVMTKYPSIYIYIYVYILNASKNYFVTNNIFDDRVISV